MKKKLFTAIFAVSLYCLFIIAFTSFDNQGNVSKFFTEIGLGSTPAQASIVDTQVSLKSIYRRPIKSPRSPADPPK